MTPWPYADPRLLTEDDILEEHDAVHAISRGTHEDADWWMAQPKRKSFIIMRHELIRLAMNRRWTFQHTLANHPSKMKIDYMLPQHRRFVIDYGTELHEMRLHPWGISHLVSAYFQNSMRELEVPVHPGKLHPVVPWEGMQFGLDTYLRADYERRHPNKTIHDYTGRVYKKRRKRR